MSKGQGGSEYLMTYFVTLTVIVSVALVLYSLGILDPSAWTKKGARGFDYFVYSDHKITTDGHVDLVVKNLNKRIELKELVVRDKETGISYSSSLSGTYGKGEKIVISAPTDIRGGEDASYIYEFQIKYRSVTGLSYTDTGIATGSYAAGTGLSAVSLSVTEAFSYQNEGTTSCDDTSLLNEGTTPADNWAPDPCGSVSVLYYATGTSSAYFDAVAVRFDVTGYDPTEYEGTVRFFIRHGDYSDPTWRHYKVYDDWMATDCQDSPPPCDGSPTFPNGFEGWIGVPLSDDYWSDGDLSLRLWNVYVDTIVLQLEPE